MLNSSIIVMIFLSTLSLRRATFFLPKWAATVKYFYPRSPCGERLMTTGIKLPKPRFLSTLSLRRATNPLWLMGYDVGFLSTLSLRRATACIPACVVGASISIHALLAESDPLAKVRHCEGYVFLSTLSLRRATPRSRKTGRQPPFLSTLSLRRATLYLLLAGGLC